MWCLCSDARGDEDRICAILKGKQKEHDALWCIKGGQA